MADSLKLVNTRRTPQTQQAAPEQRRNNAGGYVFTISAMERARRFLILGSEGSFYQSGQELSTENADSLITLCESERHDELVDMAVAVSTAGRAPKQNPAVFALAVAASFGTTEQRAYALSKLQEVCRTATTLFMFLGYVQQFRGWGPALRRAVSEWYTDKTVPQLAYQMVKYRSREGWTHRDVFRKAHPETRNLQMQALGEWALRGEVSDETPALVRGYTAAANPENAANLPDLIAGFGLSWEMVPTEALNRRDVWEALLEGNVPLGALIRQLPRLTSLGMLQDGRPLTRVVAARLQSEAELRRARIHPLRVLVALKTYSQGYSEKSDLGWKPSADIVDALDKAFYTAFGTVEPTGKRAMLALDVSGSMDWVNVAGMPITARQATAAMALVTKAVEPETFITAFSTRMVPVNISPRQRLDDVVRKLSGIPMGGTDCAQPMIYAKQQGIDVDAFVVYTDSETWGGGIHVHQALREYRQSVGHDVKLVVVATTATRFSIADPKDSGMLDVAGFDTATPNAISEFIRGGI